MVGTHGDAAQQHLLDIVDRAHLAARRALDGQLQCVKLREDPLSVFEFQMSELVFFERDSYRALEARQLFSVAAPTLVDFGRESNCGSYHEAILKAWKHLGRELFYTRCDVDFPEFRRNPLGDLISSSPASHSNEDASCKSDTESTFASITSLLTEPETRRIHGWLLKEVDRARWQIRNTRFSDSENAIANYLAGHAAGMELLLCVAVVLDFVTDIREMRRSCALPACNYCCLQIPIWLETIEDLYETACEKKCGDVGDEHTWLLKNVHEWLTDDCRVQKNSGGAATKNYKDAEPFSGNHELVELPSTSWSTAVELPDRGWLLDEVAIRAGENQVLLSMAEANADAAPARSYQPTEKKLARARVLCEANPMIMNKALRRELGGSPKSVQVIADRMRVEGLLKTKPNRRRPQG